MGNIGSSAGNVRRRQGSRRGQPLPPPPPPPMHPLQQHVTMANRYMYSETPYPNPNGHNPYYQYPGYYPPPPAITMPIQGPYDHLHHRPPPPMYPCPMMPPPAPYVEHQKAMTIRNDVNLKRETLKVEPDEENPGSFLVAFTFDAMVAGSMTVIFFAKEGDDCDLTPTKEESIPPIVVPFEQGLGQKFRQPCGTGIDFSKFEESELLKEGNLEVFPLAIKAEATSASAIGDDDANRPNTGTSSSNSQITKVVFEKEKGQFRVKVVKQILWVNGMRYELHEIYGIGGNSVEGGIEDDGNDPGKECVICLSEPRDTTVLPCRHMCMCSGCAKVLSFQTNRCPICRQPVERFLEIKVNNGLESQGEENNH